MDNFYYILILIGGSLLAYYVVFVVGKKIAPSSLKGKPLSGAIAFAIQVVLPAILIPLVAPGLLKNIDKMFEITKRVGESPYLSFVSEIFEGAESANRLWSIISLFLVFLIFKHIIENMPDGPIGLGSFAIALLIVVLAATASSILWELVAEKVWLKTVEVFDSVWWDTIPGNTVRVWLFPNQTRINP